MTIKEYTEQAVRQYLRTVLFVDDHIFSSCSSTVTKHTVKEVVKLLQMPETVNMEKRAKPTEISKPDQLEGSDESRTEAAKQEAPVATPEVNPKDIVDGFAKYGITCGLYQPPETEMLLLCNNSLPSGAPEDAAKPSDDSEIVEDKVLPVIVLCEHADVFILDWKLTDDADISNSPVPRIIQELINKSKKAGNPKPIRFCAIYTLQGKDLVLNDLKTKLKPLYPGLTIDSGVKKIVLEGITIRIYGKTGSLESAVSPLELAKEIIKDFISEYEGIMSATALQGIAHVRDNAKRILDKFPPSLDYALMVHAGLTVDAPTASEDIQDLLGDEIHSILSENRVSDEEIYAMLHERVSSIKPEALDGIFTSDQIQEGINTEGLHNFFVSLFHNRKMPKNKPFAECHTKSKPRRISYGILQKLQTLVSRLSGKQSYSAGALSRLFCLRTIYESKRLLKTGTVVRNLSDNNYYLCLMPACDCVRLAKRATSFPFWELAKVNESHEGRAHAIVIHDADGNSISLCLKGKIRKQMKFWTFLPDNQVIFQEENGKIIITEESTSEEKTKFEWIAELKPLHAQRMIEYVSQQFSRVGLAESEWLRLQVDR